MAHERRGAPASSAAAHDAAGEALFVDIVHEAPLSGQRQPRSIVGGTLYCILLAGYAGVAVAAPWIFVLIPDMILPLLCSCNVLLLIITGIFQQYWVHQVTKVRLQGYYDLSQKLKRIARVPFATIACGTALMLLILVWHPQVEVLSISVLLRIALVVEVISAGCFMSLYIGHIHKYNSLNEQPDILRPLYSALQPSSSLEEIRYYDSCLSDQQMALLQYQRENIHYLSEEVLRLQENLSKYHRSVAASTPQVDLTHLLASRDQELRALSAEVITPGQPDIALHMAEMASTPKNICAGRTRILSKYSAGRTRILKLFFMNQVHSELRLARGLIAEKDSEIQHIRGNNNQYVEENERLRAILGEWSTRAAKLERALEAERVSNMELQKNRAKLRRQSTKEKIPDIPQAGNSSTGAL